MHGYVYQGEQERTKAPQPPTHPVFLGMQETQGQPSQFASVLQYTSESLDELQKQVVLLSQRLAPLCRQFEEQAPPPTAASLPGASGLVMYLHGQLAQIHGIQSEIQSLHAHLDL